MSAGRVTLGLLLCGLSLAPTARGLRAQAGLQGVDDGNGCQERQPFRQTMKNDHDVQYFVQIKIGGQEVTGIMDTGSFELVVFSAGCGTCGTAGAYDERGSRSFEAGGRTQTHSYGSGSCKSKDGWDTVDIGCYSAPHQAMWLATECQMPVLDYASFNAIIGVGPPGQPEMSARRQLAEAKEIEDRARAEGKSLPGDFEEKKAAVQAQLEDALAKRDLLENLGSEAFSICLGKESGSDAYFIWNDVDRSGQEGVITFPVVGAMTWSVKISGISLHFGHLKRKVGCESGCGAVVDSGTSLIGMPSDSFRNFAKHLQSLGFMGCEDLSKYPDLVITINDQNLHFPPSAYLGRVNGEVNEDVSQFMHMGALQGGQDGQEGAAGNTCEMMVMDLGMQGTDFGPLLILGMPFFREFYTTFHLGAGGAERSISVAPADARCYPSLSPAAQTFRTARASTAITPRVLDGSRLRAPRWLSGRGVTAL